MADQGQSGELFRSSDIRLELLGPVRLGNSAGDDLTPRPRKTRALLAILALSKAPLTRSRLSELLWGDRGEEQAKASLRQALYELRDLASRGFISAGRETVSIGPKRLPSDFGTLQQQMDDGDCRGLIESLRVIAHPLLGTLDGITPELDEWLRDERNRLSASITERSTAIARAALEAAEVLEARQIADQLERLEPLDEPAVQLGIRADLASGDRSAANRRYARFSERLKSQLGIDPAADTDALLRGDSAPMTQAAQEQSPREAASQRHHRKWKLVVLVVALLLLVGTALTFVLLRPSGTAAMPTVAILPFDDLGHKNQDYFASGVSDEILNLLAHQQTMKVLGRISAEQVAGGANPLTRARELGVAYVLDGSVRTGDGQVLVIARLTRVADGSQVWSERYQRRIGDIFAVQGDIASAVASRLAQSFAAPRPQGTTPAVYDRYLAARQLTRERREVTLAAAERLLRQAIALDPHYAPSFAELAQVIMLESDHPTAYGSLPVDKARAEAEPFARKAIALDPNLGDGYAALGFLPLAFDADSERYFRKAVQLSPQRADFHRWHAESLLALNRYDDAISEYARAVDIDPLWGLNYDHLMGALYLVGRKDEARSYARRFLALSTDDRAKRLIVLSLDKLDLNLAGELKTAEALYHAYPNERQNRINLAATLAQLGERRRAAEIMAGDDMAVAATSGDWTGLARAVQSLGSNFWGRSGWWDAAGLLVASGHSDALLRLYDRDAVAAKRTIIADNQNIAMSDIIVALRQHGRSADAEQLLAILRRHAEQLPAVGILGDEKAIDGAAVAALAGDREGAIRRLDQLSRTKPLQLTLIPGMALRHEPAFAPLATDPRFDAIEDRVRDATNAERAKAGLPPISRSAWISDSKTVLTKN